MTKSQYGTVDGGETKCRSCGAPIFWVITPKGRRMPVDPTDISHFATCPEAARWQKPSTKKDTLGGS